MLPLFGKRFALTSTTVLVVLLVAKTSQVGASSCFPNPCKNGGTCNQPPGKSFICTCTFGFYGDKCGIPSKCHFHTVVEGKDNTDDVDVAKLTGLNMTEVDICKKKCESIPGCRAVDVKNNSCNVYSIVPISIPDMAPMRSEQGRLFAIRRCFKKKTPTTTASSAPPNAPEEPQEAKVSETEKTEEKEQREAPGTPEEERRPADPETPASSEESHVKTEL